MRRHIIILTVLLLTSFGSIAQVFQIGAAAHFYRQSGIILSSYDPGTSQGSIQYSTEISDKSGVPGVSFFYYHPVIKAGEIFSAGLQTGFEFFAIYKAPSDVRTFGGAYVGHWGTGTGLRLGYLIPTSVMVRIGNLAIKNNEKSFGGAIGLGVVPFGFNIPLEKGFMMPLNFCAEMNFKNWGLRFDLPLKKYESFYKSYTGDIPRLTNSFYSIKVIVKI